MRTRGRVVATAVLSVLALAGTVRAGVMPPVPMRGDACERSARRYETRCLMPRIEARLRFADDGDAVTFVARMRDVAEACVEVTSTGLAACPAWPRVRPSAEYRRWLKDVRETWERRQQERDGARPACPPGVWQCL